MNLEHDLTRIALQESRLRFSRFDAMTAWQIGSRLRETAGARAQAVAIDIRINGQLLFFCAMPGTTPDNADWIRRKVNTVQRFHTSSYAISLKMQQQQSNLTDKYGVSAADFVAAGGCFPVRLQGNSCCIGTITVSGLPQRQDHALVVEVLADMLGHPLAELALAEESA
ncbi:MAG: heme-degrading domain-containing protein [Thiolinea sp.]